MRQNKTGGKNISKPNLTVCSSNNSENETMDPYVLNDGTIFMEIHIFVRSVMHIPYAGRERSYLSTDFRL